jgi:glucose/arabinose dehydrogenase
VIARPAKAWPQAPAGFSVQLYATGLENPRLMRPAPNGDVFLAESLPGKIMVLRGIDSKGRVLTIETFATGLDKPFGIAFYPPGSNPDWVYIADTGGVVRFPYHNGDMKARGSAEKICDLPGGGFLRGGGHWTRDIAFTLDGRVMYVSVGSRSNDDDPDTHSAEENRADILQFNPNGSARRIFAWGIRNPVGLAIHPTSGELWASVNERDELGDNLVPDYITHVERNGFYGWPWFYMGGVQDPRQKGKHPELKDWVMTPDVLLQPHNASLEMMFYEGKQFPKSYQGDIFAAEHGSWNRQERTGYEVIRIPMKGGTRAEGGYEDFLTGFVTADGEVWGRPVGVAEAADGSLLVSDDASGVVWRVSSNGK